MDDPLLLLLPRQGTMETKPNRYEIKGKVQNLIKNAISQQVVDVEDGYRTRPVAGTQILSILSRGQLLDTLDELAHCLQVIWRTSHHGYRLHCSDGHTGWY